jgi:thiol-disulfide isomerase/thioredoxin
LFGRRLTAKVLHRAGSGIFGMKAVGVWLAIILGCAVATQSRAAEIVDLAALKGRVVYLDFWASWCGPCRQSFPWMNDLQRALDKQGLVIVGVNLDQERSDADRFLDSLRPTFRIAFDPAGTLAERYHVHGMPTSVLIARDGKTLLVHQGFRIKEREALEAEIREALT